MSFIEVRSLSSVPAEPWRNGGGMTRTLATHGTEWRISLAEVERDGPYSRFDGMTRVSFIVRGHGVTLANDTSVVPLAPFVAVEYDGGDAWHARLEDGPVTALNVMSPQGRYRVSVRSLDGATIVAPHCTAIVVALDSGCRYDAPDMATSGKVGAHHFMIADDMAVPLRLAPSAAARRAHPEIRMPVLVTLEPAGIRQNH